MSNEGLVISRCPTCGSPAIRKVRGRWMGTYQGKAYCVDGIEYYSCPKCHERVYPPEAMRRIQQASPAYARFRRQARRAGTRTSA